MNTVPTIECNGQQHNAQRAGHYCEKTLQGDSRHFHSASPCQDFFHSNDRLDVRYPLLNHDNIIQEVLVWRVLYMFLWSEESLFLPPLIPTWLHILWTVRGREQQAGVCNDKALCYVCRETQQVDKLVLEMSNTSDRKSVTFLCPRSCLSSVHYLLLLTPFFCYIFRCLETKTSMFK